MSRACGKCGEHCLDCECSTPSARGNEKFFYQGKYFEKEEEFWAYVQDFTFRKTSAEDFDSLFDTLKKDIWMNLMIQKPDTTNSDVMTLVDEGFMFFVERMCAKDEQQ